MSGKAYFSVLDPLRLIASLAVLLAHSVLFFRTGTWSAVIFPRVIGYLGYYGVVFFCVLSGFLITYLLLKEREATGKIAIGSFYMRRILRIWPLYYLIILASFFVLPYLWPWKEYWLGDVSPVRKLLLYALFLPNLAYVIGPNVVTCFQTYSIGYEEQFYLFWPFVMRMKRKYMTPFLATLFFGDVLLEILQYELAKHLQGQPGAHKVVRLYIPLVIMSYVPAFVAGAFAAMVYLKGGAGLLRWRWKGWRYVLTGVLFLIIFFAMPGVMGLINVLSVVYALLILHLIQQPEVGGKGRRLFATAGRLSYGVYMWHPTILILVAACLNKAGAHSYLLYLTLSLVLVMLVAYLSYRYFERPFLQKKRSFTPLDGQGSLERAKTAG